MLKYGIDEYGRYGEERNGDRFAIEPYPFRHNDERHTMTLVEEWRRRASSRLWIIRWWLRLGWAHRTRVYCHQCFANTDECNCP